MLNMGLTRFYVFLLLCIVLFALERLRPYWINLKGKTEKMKRWSLHFWLIAITYLLVYVLFPMSLIDFANEQGPILKESFFFGSYQLVCLIIFDLTIYFQHRLLHHFSFLWRLHRLHHQDLFLDASSALRFHPLEMILSLVIKMGLIFILRPSSLTVLTFEVLLSSFALFSHANIKISEKWEKIISFLFVTPKMHRVHHSMERDDINKNFGFCLSWWDDLFSTRRKSHHVALDSIGLGNIRVECDLISAILDPIKKN